MGRHRAAFILLKQIFFPHVQLEIHIYPMERWCTLSIERQMVLLSGRGQIPHFNLSAVFPSFLKDAVTHVQETQHAGQIKAMLLCPAEDSHPSRGQPDLMPE